KPLWKRLLIAADSAVGELLGEMYVASVFPETSKHTILEMVEKIRDVYSKRISNLDWMSPKSQKIAISKLNNIKVRVGYPDKWRDYSHLKIDRYNFIGNLLAAAEHDTKYSLDKVGKRPPIEEWHMTPQTVNAYHDPNRLEIVFPAAILQYPFFDPNSHYAANLAGIGYVIGHEFTHGFDDQGSLFDANGELKPWMTKSEKQSFHLRSKYIRESANNFEVIDGVFMIGDLVIGEAIADLGGAELAWQVLQNELSAGAISHTDSNGLDAEHVFFYALATVERQNESAESALQAAKSDPHPDPRFRVNGIVPHMDAFYNVFEISPNDRLYRAPKTRSKIW
ncbi:M13 family metallopeptidase, partial [Candidatus Saccharibacteria bacterium]|nr:M13 family metallopeptidase [Candidatus Saccharibacteria bacterium]